MRGRLLLLEYSKNSVMQIADHTTFVAFCCAIRQVAATASTGHWRNGHVRTTLQTVCGRKRQREDYSRTSDGVVQISQGLRF